MKRTAVIMILIALRIPLFSQLNITDTFNIVLKQHFPDSVKIDKLNQYIFRYSSNNPEITLIYSDSAIALSEKIQDSARLALSVNRKGVALFYLGDYNSSLESYFLALSIKGKSGDTISVWRERGSATIGRSFSSSSNRVRAARRCFAAPSASSMTITLSSMSPSLRTRPSSFRSCGRSTCATRSSFRNSNHATGSRSISGFLRNSRSAFQDSSSRALGSRRVPRCTSTASISLCLIQSPNSLADWC